MTDFPVGFKHPKTHLIQACQICGKPYPDVIRNRKIPYGWYVVCEECILKATKEKK